MQVVHVAESLEKQVKQDSIEQLQDRFRLHSEEAEALACIREAIRRTLSLRLYDEQLMAGLVLMRGELAEMATGEGKTLVAAIPAATAALSGKGVHVATVNAYLAERDEEILRPAYAYLGLRSAWVPDQGESEEKREAYAADISYGTGYGFGFDFLRDRLHELSRGQGILGEDWLRELAGFREQQRGKQVQRPLHMAVIDEVDSVLIDEAMTPLILSRPTAPGQNPAAPLFHAAEQVARSLLEGEHVLLEAAERPRLTHAGLAKVYEQQPQLPQAWYQRAWHHYVESALQAKHQYFRDIHYLVEDDKVELIDLSTGRRFKDRKWRNGLHQAVEAKEAVSITHESRSDVSISRQQLYQMYPKLCGMTGTAWEARREFERVYALPTRCIPRHRPLLREEWPSKQFSSLDMLLSYVIQELRKLRSANRPVLIGTRSLKVSEQVSLRLHEVNIPHALLNARQDAEEAKQIQQAGQAAQVTVATNMAGRGADIPLDEAAERAGGLHVFGVEWNDAARIDRQLAGRAGRQGQPGSYQKLASAEDPLLQPRSRKHAPSAREIRQAQREKEQEGLRQRRALMQHHKWLDKLKEHA